MSQNLKYRRDIDGLRAVAVLPVMLFHAGVPGFSGGYVGVDIFFVISGYLITLSLLSDAGLAPVERIARFYERRIRRILPALFIFLISTLTAGTVLFLPHQLISLGQSAVATSLFASNFWFWTQSGYFAAPAEMMPLLHTWSLAVEEQFYIAFPLFLILVGHERRIARWAVPSLALMLFAINAALTFKSPGAAFYWPIRSWELLAGSALALFNPAGSRVLREIAGIAGLVMIAASILLFTSSLPFPGTAALLPVAGSVAAIYAGENSLCGRLLAQPHLVMIGLISYSLYLWHWPILVFAKQVLVMTELPPQAIVCCIALTFLLAFLSWRFVETPFRQRQTARRMLFSGAGASMATILVGAVCLVAANGLPGRFSAEALSLASAKTALRPDNCAKDGAFTCTTGMTPSFALIGDSHAGAISPALDQAAGAPGFFSIFNGCPPFPVVPDNLRGSDKERCAKHTPEIVKRIQSDPQIRTVVIAGYWSAYTISESDVRPVLDALRDKQVILLGDNPAPGFNVPWTLALGGHVGPLRPQARPAWFAVADTYPNLKIVDLSTALCSNEVCDLRGKAHALYADGNHVSDYAARSLIAPLFTNILGAPFNSR